MMVEPSMNHFILKGQDYTQEEHESSYILQTLLEAYKGGRL